MAQEQSVQIAEPLSFNEDKDPANRLYININAVFDDGKRTSFIMNYLRRQTRPNNYPAGLHFVIEDNYITLSVDRWTTPTEYKQVFKVRLHYEERGTNIYVMASYMLRKVWEKIGINKTVLTDWEQDFVASIGESTAFKEPLPPSQGSWGKVIRI